MAEDTAFAQFLVQPDKLPQDVQADRMTRFVAEFTAQLITTEATSGDNWDLANDDVALDLQPASAETLAAILGNGARENRCFFKLLMSFGIIAGELAALICEGRSKIIPPLLVFGEQPDGKDLEDGDVQLCFGRVLPLLLATWNLCDRVAGVVRHLIQQLASLYSPKYKKKSPLTAYQAVHFQPVWAALADALGLLITIDEVIRQNESFARCATVFKRMMRTVRSNPSAYATDGATPKRFEYLMQRLEGDLMDDLVFQNCLRQPFEHQGTDVAIQGNSLFQAEFYKALQVQFQYLSKALTQPFETDKRYQLVGLCGLHVMYAALYPEKAVKDSDHKKFFRQLWDLQRKVPVLHLGGHAIFSPGEWLARKASDLVNAAVKDASKDLQAAPQDLFAVLESSFETQVARLTAELTSWTSKFEVGCGPDYAGDASVVKVTTNLLTQGVQYAWEVSHLFRTTLLLHMQLDRPLSVSKALLLCKCIELQKAIPAALHRKSAAIGKLVSLLCEQLSCDVARLLAPLRKRLRENEKKLDDSQIDQLSAIEVLLRALRGPPTRARLLVLRLALSVAIQKQSGLVQESDFDEARQLLRRLDLVANHQTLVQEACDCSILFWFRSLLPTYLKALVRRPELVRSLPLLTVALHDPGPVLLQARHLAEPAALFHAYATEVRTQFLTEVVQPVQKEIEDDLRLHIHAVVLGQDSRDLQQLPNLRDLSRLTTLPPLRLFGQLLDFRATIEHYLDRQFYNLSAISQHDWKTYEELRVLAKEKYDLSLMEVYLPGSNLEQGLDVLEVARNIRLFVARYSFNLNNQLFLEKPTLTNAQNLHTVHIRHVANSIRTHGTGFMDSTVNFVYQFLGKKLFIFSQFLFDDHIKSRLMQDHRGFLDTKEESGGRFPVKRAERFVKYVRKLPGQSADAGFLDLFRGLVTEIGNALGFVRMVRSGGLRFISEAAKFLPEGPGAGPFGAMADAAGLRPGTQAAAEQLDDVLATLRAKLAEGADYFRMLEQAFAAELVKEHHQHLRNFFVIVPALSLSFVDHMLAAKDRAAQKGKEASFTDDGFPLGVAFLLKVLGQNSDFDSLHWFTSIEEHYRQHLEDLALDQRRSKREPADVPTLRLTRAKVEAALREFELLFYAFRSSRVFFAEGADDIVAEGDVPDAEAEDPDPGGAA